MSAWLLLFCALSAAHSSETVLQPRGPRPVKPSCDQPTYPWKEQPDGWITIHRPPSSPDDQSRVPPQPPVDQSRVTPPPPPVHQSRVTPPSPSVGQSTVTPPSPPVHQSRVTPPSPSVGQSRVTPPPPSVEQSRVPPPTVTDSSVKKPFPPTTTITPPEDPPTNVTITSLKEKWEKECGKRWDWYDGDLRVFIAKNVLAAYRKPLDYNCVLEALAYVSLVSPREYEIITENSHIVALEYTQKSDQLVYEKFTQKAAEQWKLWFKALCGLYEFGCNLSSKPVDVPPGHPRVSLYTYTLKCLFFFKPM